jgi:hypothetical protein
MSLKPLGVRQRRIAPDMGLILSLSTETPAENNRSEASNTIVSCDGGHPCVFQRVRLLHFIRLFPLWEFTAGLRTTP